MNYRKFKADRIFTGREFLSGNFVLTTTSSGEIVGLEEYDDNTNNIERFKGTLCPGFVNAHCHLELSHLKGIIPKHTGLIPFLIDVVDKRAFPAEEIQDKMELAIQEMHLDGVVAVGDIGNTPNSIGVKAKGRMLWNNFVEVLGFRDENFENIRQQNLDVFHQFKETEKELPKELFKTSLVPHAPYTVGTSIFEWINQETTGMTISCHNQETLAEDQLYQTGQGDFLRLLKKFNIEGSPFPVTGKSSLQSWLPHFNRQQKLILVHNTFINEVDIDFALNHAGQYLSGLFFCICINANLYIENKLPPVEMLVQKGVELVIGTDSYSSNDQLSVAAEIRMLRKKFPSIPLDLILRWATYNGAKALGRENEIGSFDKGKQPGILLLNDKLESKRIL